MNTEIQPFEFEHNQVRAFADGDEVMFVASDIAKILGYRDAANLTRTLDADEKGTYGVSTPRGGVQNMTVITESGLYRAGLNRETGHLDGEKKAFVHRFQRWVTHEVLPSIRKHGATNPTKEGDQMSDDIVEVPFNGSMMIAQRFDDGEIYTALKPICENIGIDFNGQKQRLERTPWATMCVMHTVAADGKNRDMTAISRKTLTMWLATIDTNRLGDEQARHNVTVYQQEAAEALDKYFNEGGAIRISEADSDEDILARAVLVAQKTIERKNQQLRIKNAQIMELKPKAQALDAFTDVEDKLLVRDAAKILSNAGTPISEKQLREWMTDNDWIYKSNGSWHATAKHCTAGHLTMVMSQKHGARADGTKFAFPPTVRITRKGLALLHKRLYGTILNKALETIND